MDIIPCEDNQQLRALIEEYAEALKAEAHKLGNHGLTEEEFYQSSLFRGAIERIRGQFSATMVDKRDFVKRVLNYMEDNGFIREWDPSGDANRHDYSITLNSGRIAVIETKGCLDGNNTTIFERPQHANEFVIWGICSNKGADMRHNAWSGIHTRLSPEIIKRPVQLDGVIIWDMVCGTLDRPCPKLIADLSRATELGPFTVPPPCIYLMPGTVPAPRNNPSPPAQSIDDVEILKAFHTCFKGKDEELNYVQFEVRYEGNDIVRTTSIRRGSEVYKSRATAIRRA